MAVQELMAKRNVDVPDDRRMQFRIGVMSTLATCWSKATISLVMASMSPPASKALQSRAAATSASLVAADDCRLGRIEKILGAARRLPSRAARLDPALLSQIQIHPCNMILTYRPKALGAVLGPDAGEGEQWPILIQREPDDILLGLRVRLRRIFSEAVGRDQASVLRL
jgi:hypothetical protein